MSSKRMPQTVEECTERPRGGPGSAFEIPFARSPVVNIIRNAANFDCRNSGKRSRAQDGKAFHRFDVRVVELEQPRGGRGRRRHLMDGNAARRSYSGGFAVGEQPGIRRRTIDGQAFACNEKRRPAFKAEVGKRVFSYGDRFAHHRATAEGSADAGVDDGRVRPTRERSRREQCRLDGADTARRNFDIAPWREKFQLPR